MTGNRTGDCHLKVQRPHHYTTKPPSAAGIHKKTSRIPIIISPLPNMYHSKNDEIHLQHFCLNILITHYFTMFITDPISNLTTDVLKI